MSFNKRREYLFIYTVKDANPNGDPLDANHPRFDEESGQIMVSDVRIKRTIRDQWLREGENVFVDGEAKTLNSRVDELKKEFDVKTGRDALAQCIDTRLFGVTFALNKESFSWTGPVQFKWGRSLHKAESKLIQGTAAFATKEGSEQRSFRNEYIVPFATIAVYGIANQYASRQTGATDDDLNSLSNALWGGTINLITRSKIGHAPKMLLEIAYIPGFEKMYYGANLDQKGALVQRICLPQE
jgi:CRISPR-associated protein Csh2